MAAYDLLTGFSYFMCATSDRHPTNHTPHALALARSSALSRTHTNNWRALGYLVVLSKWGQVMRWLLESRNIALSRWWQQPHSVTNKGYLYHPHVILAKAEIGSSYRSVDHLHLIFRQKNQNIFCF